MRLITAALSATALIGCGTAQKAADVAADPPAQDQQQQSGSGARAAKGAVGGAAMGAVMCLSVAPAGLAVGGIGAIGSVLASLVCLPFGVVVGAVAGGSVAAARSPGSQSPAPIPTARQGVSPTKAAQNESGYRTQGAFVLAAAGQLDVGQGLPPGTLYVAMNTIVASDDNQRRASLIVDFEGPTPEGEKSMTAQAVFACERNTVSIGRSFTYADRFSHGEVIHSLEHVPPIVVETPSPVMSSAMRTVCDAGPWWNTPVQLYGE